MIPMKYNFPYPPPMRFSAQVFYKYFHIIMSNIYIVDIEIHSTIAYNNDKRLYVLFSNVN